MTSCFPAADYRGKYRHFPPIIFLKWNVCKCEIVLIVLYIEDYKGIYLTVIVAMLLISVSQISQITVSFYEIKK